MGVLQLTLRLLQLLLRLLQGGIALCHLALQRLDLRLLLRHCVAQRLQVIGGDGGRHRRHGHCFVGPFLRCSRGRTGLRQTAGSQCEDREPCQ